MGQLSLASPHTLVANKRTLAVVLAVLIGHASTLWLLAHMQPFELRQIPPKKPVQVHFVKIEQPKPDIPKPKQPEKPKDKPKPQQVKIVEKPRAPPPKTPPKVQQVVKSEAKPVTKAPEIESKVISTVVTTEVKVQKPAAASAPPQNTTNRNTDSSPRQVSEGEISWKRKPAPAINKSDLNRATDLTVVVRINANPAGKITKVAVVKSSGSARVDGIVLRAVRAASFYPYIVDGQGVPVYADLPIHIQ